MIIITGSVSAKEGRLDELKRLAQAHVERSRTETGCLSHAMSLDAENPQRLLFVEQWTDMEAVQAHFAAPGSKAFARAAAEIGEGAELRIFEATLLRALP